MSEQVGVEQGVGLAGDSSVWANSMRELDQPETAPNEPSSREQAQPVVDQFKQLEHDFWEASKIIRAEELLEGHYEDSDEPSVELIAHRREALMAEMGRLRQARQADHPLIALRAEYLTVCLYGRIDHSYTDDRLLDDDLRQEFDSYRDKYGNGYFDDQPESLDEDESQSFNLPFVDVSGKVVLPEQVYEMAKKDRPSFVGVKAFQVARDGVVFLAESLPRGGYDAVNVVAEARLDAQQLDQAETVKLQPSQLARFESVVQHGRLDVLRELLQWGPEFLEKGHIPWQSQDRQTATERRRYWEERIPALDSAEWRLVYESTADRQYDEDKPVSVDDFLREASLGEYLTELGIDSGKANQMQDQMTTYLRQVHQQQNKELAPVFEVHALDTSNDTTMLWRDFFLEPGMQEALSKQFELDMTSMSLAAQRQLVAYLGRSTIVEFNRLKQIVSGRDDESKLSLFESFLALEHGDEFGDSLLTIVEQLPEETSQEILSELANIRQLAHENGQEYHDFDPEFAQQFEQAWVSRTTQVLLNAQELAEGRTPSVTRYDGTVKTISSIGEVTWGLRLLRDRLSRELSHLRDGGGVIERQDSTTTTIRMPDGGLEQLRPYAAEQDQHDEEHHFDDEARANSLASTDSWPFTESRNDPARVRALSIRIDREGIWRNEAGEPLRDRQNKLVNLPTGEYGWVSLDIGGLVGEPDDPNVRIGALMAAGAAIFANRRGQVSHQHHVREVFAERFGRKEEFARLVRFRQERLLRQISKTVSRPASSEQKLAS